MTCVRYSSRTEEDHDKLQPFCSGDMLQCFISALRDMLQCFVSAPRDMLCAHFLSFIASFVLMSHSAVCSTVLEKLRASFD